MVGAKSFPAANHVPMLIYPNPLNPQRYVVLNSGFTFREADYLNNARQVPKLPDYAVIDVDSPPNATNPSRAALGGFFGERWELLADDGKGTDGVGGNATAEGGRRMYFVIRASSPSERFAMETKKLQ